MPGFIVNIIQDVCVIVKQINNIFKIMALPDIFPTTVSVRLKFCGQVIYRWENIN